MKTLTIKELKIYGEILFGEYWHKPFTEAIGVTEEQLTKWLSPDPAPWEQNNVNAVPFFVNEEIKKLLEWKAFETKESLKILNVPSDSEDFYKIYRRIKVDYYPHIPKKLTFEKIKHIVALQVKYILGRIKYRIANYDPLSLEEAIEFADDFMIGEFDIANYVERAIENEETILTVKDKNGQTLVFDNIQMFNDNGYVEIIQEYRAEKLDELKWEIRGIYDRIPVEYQKKYGIFVEED